MTSVLLVDDQNLVLMGIKTMLEPIVEITVQGAVKNGREAVEYLSKNEVDVVVMDISMPEMDGLETVTILRSKYPGIKAIALTVFRDPELIKKSISIGFSGYLLKSSSLEELVEAILKVGRGQEYFSAEVTKMLIASYKPESNKKSQSFREYQPFVRSNSDPKLSKREMEILKELVTGKSAKKIAEELSISLHTVHSHRKNILTKLKISDTAGLVKYAIQHDIISF